MDQSEEVDRPPVPKRGISSTLSRLSDNTDLTEGQLKWYKHNKIFEAIIPDENKLLWIDWVKESNRKSEKLQISDLSMLIHDKMNENIEVLEKYQSIFAK